MKNTNPRPEYTAFYVARDDGDYDLMQVWSARMREERSLLMRLAKKDPEARIIEGDALSDFPDVLAGQVEEPATEEQVAEAVEKLSSPELFEVLTDTECDGWVNTWVTTELGNSTAPMRFASTQAAELAIAEHIADCNFAVNEGHLDDAPTRADFRIAKVGATEEAYYLSISLTRAPDPFNMSEHELKDEITSWLSDLGFTVDITCFVSNQR